MQEQEEVLNKARAQVMQGNAEEETQVDPTRRHSLNLHSRAYYDDIDPGLTNSDPSIVDRTILSSIITHSPRQLGHILE